MHQTTIENIRHAQAKQQRDYIRLHQVNNNIKVDQKVLLKNQKRDDRQSGKFSFELLGPYTVHAISEKDLCSLINKARKQQKTKYSIYLLLKPYLESEEKEVVCNESSSSNATNKPSYNKINSSSVHSSLELCFSYLPVQKQTNGHNFGLFSIVYAAEILDGKTPREV